MDEDISEIMQKEGSDNDSQADEDAKENERPAKRIRTEEWENSEMNYLAETPVCFKLSKLMCDYNYFISLLFRAKLLHQTRV